MRRTKYLIWFVNLAILLSVFSLHAQVPPPRKKDLERARKVAKQGDVLFNQKNYRGAIDKYTEAITIVPQFPAAHFWKGYAHYYLNEYDQSLTDLNQAESQKFDKPLEIYKLRWFLNYQEKNYDAALNDALAASRLDPNNATYNLALGDIYRIKESYRDAVNYYQKGAAQDPNNKDVYYYLAFCYASLNQPRDQAAAALEALKRNTKYPGESNFYAADALTKQKKFNEAVEFYQRAIELKPDIYGSYIGLSDIYRSRNEFDQAIAVAQKGLEVFPKDAPLYTSLAWYYSLADRPKDAITAAKTAINLDPDQYMGYTNLCRAYNDLKDYQQALTNCNSALKLKPDDGETFLYMARAYEFLKQNDKAADYYKRAVNGLIKFTEANPDYSDGYYLLGNAHFALGNDNDAIIAYNKCLMLAPRFARARFTLGFTYLAKGDKPKARDQYNILRPIDPALAEKLRQAIEK